MAKNTIDKLVHETWEIVSGNNQTFTLTKDGSIFVSEDTAIGVALDDAVTGAHLVIDGDVAAFGGDSVGLYIDGNGADVDIGKDASVTARYGVYAGSVNAKIDNRGEVHAVETGIIADGATLIRNAGVVFGDLAIENQTSADLRVINTGLIGGAGMAIIDLGGGDDTFTNKGGFTTGIIVGGDGDDTFRLDRDTVFVYENDGEGTDTIVITRNFESKEMGEIENFVISGKKNLSLEANGMSNFITGNSGNNFIQGQGGGDVITGGKGRDTLEGGGDTDVFNFRKGDGEDVITDFTDGEDLIQMDGSTGVSNVGDLTISDTQAGIRITYGAGDSILLKDVHGITLDINDFLI